MSADGGAFPVDRHIGYDCKLDLQTAERQISLCELFDSKVISDRAFRLIVQAMTAAQFGAAVLTEQEVRHV